MYIHSLLQLKIYWCTERWVLSEAIFPGSIQWSRGVVTFLISENCKDEGISPSDATGEEITT